MKLKMSRTQMVISGIGLAFIAYGILNALFKFNINKTVLNSVGFVLIAAAIGLFLYERMKKTGDGNGDKPADHESHPGSGK